MTSKLILCPKTIVLTSGSTNGATSISSARENTFRRASSRSGALLPPRHPIVSPSCEREASRPRPRPTLLGKPTLFKEGHAHRAVHFRPSHAETGLRQVLPYGLPTW